MRTVVSGNESSIYYRDIMMATTTPVRGTLHIRFEGDVVFDVYGTD